MRRILLLPLVARCKEAIDVCIWHMFYVGSSDCVVACWNVCCAAGFFSLVVTHKLYYIN